MKTKIITICGSLKFMQQMIEIAEKLELEGNCVLSVVYPTKNKEDYTADEIEILGKMHRTKIDISDAIYVVNVGGYIGTSTKNEIEYAKQKGKEIIYLEN